MAFSDAPRLPRELPPDHEPYLSDNKVSGFAGAEVGESFITASSRSSLGDMPQHADEYDVMLNPFLPPEPVMYAEVRPPNRENQADNTSYRTVAGVGETATKHVGQPEEAASEPPPGHVPVAEAAPPDIRTEGFGAYLRWVRQGSGVTQRDVSADLHTTRGHLSAFENGRAQAKPGFVEAYMRTLGMTDEEVGELLPLYEEQRANTQAPSEAIGADDRHSTPEQGQATEEGGDGERREFGIDRVIVRLMSARGLAPRDMRPPRAHGRRGMNPYTPVILVPLLCTNKTFSEIAEDMDLSLSAVIRNTKALADHIRTHPEYKNALPPGLADTPRNFAGERHTDYEGVGKQLHDAAQERGIPYRKIAEQLGVSISVLFRLHRGNTKPAPWVVAKYAQIVGADPATQNQWNADYGVEYEARRARPELRKKEHTSDDGQGLTSS